MTTNVKLTDEQRKQLEQLQAIANAEKEQKLEDRETLKKLTDENVVTAFGVLDLLSKNIADVKARVYAMFADIIELKKQVYETTDEQYSHTFTSACGKYSIKIGYNTIDHFGDSHTAGVDGVNKFLNSLGIDDNSRMLVKMAKKLLSRDAKGTLNARKVMQLMQMAAESRKQEFIDSVQIIVDAYQPIKTKMYIHAKYREDKENEWRTMPLGITEAKLD